MNLPPALLPGACDCHVHVFEAGHALAPTATFQPPHAPATAYAAVQRQLGLQRVVVVQPTGYGFDNRCTLGALAALGSGARGVCVVPPALPEAEFERLHAAGMRGVRFMMLPGGVLPWSSLEPMAQRCTELGWHIDLQLDGRDLPQHEALLQRLRCQLVIDHLAKFLGPVPPDGAALQTLQRLLDGGRTWIKLSAPYESSRSGPPGYTDVAPLARLLAGQHPERCVWASNWPHPNVRPTPADGELLAWARSAVDDAARWQRILVDNPAALYGFGA